MAKYTPIEWKDKIVDAKGNVVQEGTPLSAANLKKMETGIADAVEKTETFAAQLADTAKQLTDMAINITSPGNGLNPVIGDVNDSANFQSIVNYAISNNKRVFIPKIPLSLSNIKINGSTEIYGDGTITKNNQANYIFHVNADSTKIVKITGITFDGNQQGNYGKEDIYVENVAEIEISHCKFKNPSKNSIFLVDKIARAKIHHNDFLEGKTLSGIIEATATFHFKSNAPDLKLDVYNNYFNTSIVYNNPTGSMNGVIEASPISIYCTNTKHAIIENNRLINAGHIDMYSNNDYCKILNNYIEQCHYSSIKVQESVGITVENNTIINQTCSWSETIRADAYARADTYGLVRNNQYAGVIRNNIIKGSQSGGIRVAGYELNPTVQAKHPSLIQNDLIALNYEVNNNTIDAVLGIPISIRFGGNVIVKYNKIKNSGKNEGAKVRSIAIYDARGYVDIEFNEILGQNNANTVMGITCELDYNFPSVTSTSKIPDTFITIKNNIIKDMTSYAIVVKNIENTHISNNKIECQHTGVKIYINYITNGHIKDNKGYMMNSWQSWSLLNTTYLEADNNKSPFSVSYGAVPTSGTWNLRDIVYITTPQAGGYIGYVCVTAGTPGVWKGFGAIQA